MTLSCVKPSHAALTNTPLHYSIVSEKENSLRQQQLTTIDLTRDCSLDAGIGRRHVEITHPSLGGVRRSLGQREVVGHHGTSGHDSQRRGPRRRAGRRGAISTVSSPGDVPPPCAVLCGSGQGEGGSRDPRRSRESFFFTWPAFIPSFTPPDQTLYTPSNARPAL
jgi:hypothetical protein